jgi:hypothetical protein
MPAVKMYVSTDLREKDGPLTLVVVILSRNMPFKHLIYLYDICVLLRSLILVSGTIETKYEPARLSFWGRLALIERVGIDMLERHCGYLAKHRWVRVCLPFVAWSAEFIKVIASGRSDIPFLDEAGFAWRSSGRPGQPLLRAIMSGR